VAAFVGNKSVEACITHFLQLPLEEPFLDSQLQVFKSSTELPVPFSSAPNPVMAQVAFLTAHVAPAVGAAAASAALQTLGTSSTSNAGDAMEVDSKPDANTQSVSLSDSQQQEAARAALKAAALTAQQMAVDEDRKALKLAAQLVALHMRKVELKMRYWDELENSLLRDREMVERARQQLINERQALYQSGHSLTAVPRS
jgi:SWI/SNF related-matrix-associated actin-dependent regulator of chromatin subfamily C